jgi:hypothetical protein
MAIASDLLAWRGRMQLRAYLIMWLGRASRERVLYVAFEKKCNRFWHNTKDRVERCSTVDGGAPEAILN